MKRIRKKETIYKDLINNFVINSLSQCYENIRLVKKTPN